MALSQALSTGITGLMTHQKCMDNIGNNLANVNTVGFKKGVFQFSTLLEQTLRGGMMADESTGRGSVNPISLGLGAQTYSINKVFTQGAIENTGNPNDMAIDGNGFFVLRQENGYAYTRAGSFYRGADGSLMAGAGLYVQGTMAVKDSSGTMTIPQDAKLQNIVIPIGTTGGQAQTTEVAFTGNLDSRQKLVTGTRLFGSTNYPTINSLQKWMWKDFDGGDPIESGKKVDETWNSLQKPSYAISTETLKYFSNMTGALPTGFTLPSNVSSYANGVVINQRPTDSSAYVTDVLVVQNTTINGNLYKAGSVINLAQIANNGQPIKVSDLNSGTPAGSVINFLPVVEEVKVVNGGNVQTSAAYGIEVPEYAKLGSKYTVDGVEYTVQNNQTFPPWFYESTGGSFAVMSQLSSPDVDGVPATSTPPNLTPQQILDAVWGDSSPNSSTLVGYDGILMNRMPVPKETLQATLDTPLEHLMYRKGNVWTKPFANIKNGDTIDISFKKGEAQVAAQFVYNRPVPPSPFNGQVNLHQENSYTLEHFLKFLGGDVDEPTVACQRITPALFGAVVSAKYPDGDPNYDATTNPWNQDAYEEALRDVSLAKDSKNLDSTGGAMGLLSIPPQISDANYGTDAYDAPLESAGAYTRTGVSTVMYKVWDPSINSFVEKPGASFNTSFVSNLGTQNALSDIRITYNSVPHEAMYKAETVYNAPQGGSSMVTVDFYDSLGNPKQATLRMAMVEQNDDFTTWRWYADCVDDTDFPWQADPLTNEIMSNLNIGTGLIRFDKNGNFVKGSEYSETSGITINQSMKGVNEPIYIQLLNGLAGTQDLDFSDMTCTAAANSFKMKRQNGYPPGTLNDFTVSLDGVIQGIYSNGNVIEIGRIGLAMFANENGLVAAGNNLFFAGPGSGDPLYGHANTGGNGTIRHMQLESSNVDLSEEFTKLISTERGFQANSRTITTADEMITELLNLKR